MPDPLPAMPSTAVFVGPRWSHDAERDAPQAVWVYRLQKPHWQQAVLTSDGMFAVVSDYGNYAHNWISWGPAPFQEFFAGVSADYLLCKIARTREAYDPNQTRTSIRDAVGNAYRIRSVGRQGLRTLLELLRDHDLDTAEGANEFFDEEIDHKRRVSDVLGAAWEHISLKQEYDSDARNYVGKLLTVLQQAIRAQLASGDAQG